MSETKQKERWIGDPIEENKVMTTLFKSGCPFDDGIEKCDHTLDDCLSCDIYKAHKEGGYKDG